MSSHEGTPGRTVHRMNSRPAHIRGSQYSVYSSPQKNDAPDTSRTLGLMGSAHSRSTCACRCRTRTAWSCYKMSHHTLCSRTASSLGQWTSHPASSCDRPGIPRPDPAACQRGKTPPRTPCTGGTACPDTRRTRPDKCRRCTPVQCRTRTHWTHAPTPNSCLVGTESRLGTPPGLDSSGTPWTPRRTQPVRCTPGRTGTCRWDIASRTAYTGCPPSHCTGL